MGIQKITELLVGKEPSMLKHIVLFKLKPSAEGKSKEVNARKIKTGLESLTASIPQIKRMEVGINCIRRWSL